MPDEKLEGQEPVNSDQESQIGKAADGQEPEDEAFDKERALATIRKLRESEKLAKQYAKELEGVRAKLKAEEEAKLSEAERLAQRLAEAERKQAEYERERQERALAYEVLRVGTKLGIIDPDAAYKLLDRAELEFAEDGTPTNIEKVLGNLVKQRPYLVQTVASVSATNPARTTAQVETEDEKKARLFGRSRSPFDEDVLRAKGGGVFFKE